MTREINFSNIHISLQEFQKLSQGDYNAGEVKLASETRLAKINNHVHRLRANNQTLSHEEILAIKDAFVRALSDSGVQQKELSRVRQELGLSPDCPADKDLSHRSLKPLSRQQIRQILDRNAQAINQSAGKTIVRTSEQLYAGRSDAKAAQVDQKRSLAADATEARRALTENQLLSLYQKTLAGDTDFLPAQERPQALQFAKAQRAAILQNARNNPSANKPCTLVFQTDTGAGITLSAGVSEADAVRRLDEQILRLAYHPAPSQQDQALLDQYLAVGENAPRAEREEARKDWALQLPGTPKNGKLIRTAVVSFLQQHGIQDHKTLAIVNSKSAALASNLLQTLSMTFRNFYGQAFLDQRPALDNILHLGGNEEIPLNEQAFLPGFSPADKNALVAGILTSSDPERTIPFEFEQMAAECKNTAARHFGEAFVNTNDAVHGFADDNAVREFCDAETAAGREVTAENLRDAFLVSGLKNTAQKFLQTELAKLLPQDANNANTSARLAKTLASAHPGLLQELIDAGSPTAAHAVLGRLDTEMREMALRGATVDSLRGAPLRQMICDGIAKGLGLSELALRNTGDAFAAQADEILAALSDDILSGANGAKDLEQIRGAFQEKATEAAHQRLELLEKADSLQLPARQTDAIKAILLGADSVRDIDLDALATQARLLNLSAIADALATEDAPDKSAVYAAMGALGQALNANPANPANAQLLVQLATTQAPELAEKLDAFLARADVDADLAAARKNPASPAAAALPFLGAVDSSAKQRAGILESLGTSYLPPLYTKALLDAIDQAGLEKLTIFDKSALFAPGTELGQMLREAALSLDPTTPLLPSHLTGLAAKILASVDKAPILARNDAYLAFRGTVEAPALRAGYHKREISSLCDAFRLYQQATHCTDTQALHAVLDQASPARRLYSYGGRFHASPENFAKGLALLEKFPEWYRTTADAIHQKDPVTGKGERFPANPSPTVINGEGSFFLQRAAGAYERFLFQEIAVNDALSLDPQDPEDAFGMQNNPAMRFVGRGYTSSCTDTIAQVPPKLRRILYRTLDLLLPLQNTPEDARKTSFNSDAALFVGRTLAHLDEIRQMQDSGTFTREDFLNRFYSEVPEATFKSTREMFTWYTNEFTENLLATKFNGDFSKLVSLSTTMTSSGCTVAEGVDAVLQNRRLPSAPYVASATGKLEDMDGTPQGGRTQAVMDLIRPTSPTRISDGQALLPEASKAFVARFSDGTILRTRHNGDTKDTTASANTIATKVEEFVGRIHPEQLSAVLFGLSQSGAACLQNSLSSYDIKIDEHAALVYDLSRDEGTGAITIRYSQPEGFPLKFHWETQVTLNGTSLTTPLVVEPLEK